MNKKQFKEIRDQLKKIEYSGHLRFFILITLIGILNIILYTGLR